MEKRVERLGYDVAFSPPGDADCFYASAVKALGIENLGPEKVIFATRGAIDIDFLLFWSTDKFFQFLLLGVALKASILTPFLEQQTEFALMRPPIMYLHFPKFVCCLNKQ